MARAPVGWKSTHVSVVRRGGQPTGWMGTRGSPGEWPKTLQCARNGAGGPRCPKLRVEH